VSAEQSPLEAVEDILNSSYGVTEALLADSMRLLDTLALNMEELSDRGLQFYTMRSTLEAMSLAVSAVMQHHGVPEQ
jgi:hypothetical protein